jgi:hypothetical protein
VVPRNRFNFEALTIIARFTAIADIIRWRGKSSVGNGSLRWEEMHMMIDETINI